MFKRLFSKQNRALLAELVRTDFKLRYQGSILGYAWSLLKPLLIFIILYVVFVKFLKLGAGVPHYPIYLFTGIVIWNFINEVTLQSATCIVGRGDLVRKIRIPRWMIVFATSLAALINFSLNLVVVAAFMIINHVAVKGTLPLVIPLFFEIYIFALGISFFLSALYVKFRDVTYIWEVVLQGGFYITPILYPLSKITNVTLQKIILLNPIAQAMQDIRYNAVTHDTITTHQVFAGGYYIYIPYIIVVVVLITGTLYFKKEAKYFAENI
ncbi:MAG: ABC transporter permease [Candidatus Saccharibacteria bacterium]